MTSRQFMGLSIVDLETIADNHWNDFTFLKKVKEELKHRNTNRAKSLVAKINKHLSVQKGQLKNEIKFCPDCGDMMEIKKGKYGAFWACASYPNCSYSEKVTKEDYF